MKVLFLLTYYTPHWTGLTQYARRLAEGLVTRKHTVRVVTTQHDAALPLTETIRGVHVVRKPIVFRLSRTLISVSFIASFFSYIRAHDVVVVYLPFAEVLLAVTIARLLRKKIYLVHNGDLLLPKGSMNRLLERFYHLSTSLSIRWSNGIIIQTEDYASHSPLLSQHKKKWQVILPLYDDIAIDQTVLRNFKKKTKNSTAIIGFAGRFVEEKGFDILLQAMPLVIQKIPNAQFVFAGDMHISYENFFQKNQELLEKNKHNLVLLGRLQNKEIGSFYHLCDLFVISSRSDCFPSTEVEALRCGIPVVVTDIPGARWPVQQTGMGVIVAAADPVALADGIIRVLQNRKQYVQSHKIIESIFNYKKTLSSYEHLFTK